MALFGLDNKKIKNGEKIYKSKKVEIFHIASMSWMKKLFTLPGMSGISFTDASSGIEHSCCGKVNTVYGGKNLIGYIIDEFRGKWVVHLGNNKKVNMLHFHY